MKDLEYNGTQVIWITNNKLTYKASSGLPEYQNARFQKVKDKGPIPEGEYSFKLDEDPKEYAQAYFKTCDLKRSNLLQKIPRGDLAVIPNAARPVYAEEPDPITGMPIYKEITTCDPFWINWGNNRVGLTPRADTKTFNRSGFYLHDSQKSYSHGCIEIEPRFFDDLRSFMKKSKVKVLVLNVKYPAPDVVTSWHLK